MKITFAKDRKPNPYISRNGNTTFVYNVEGTPEELADYKAAKKTFYREDEKTKTPLFFSTEALGGSAELVKTSKGDFVADRTKERIFKSLEDQYGTTQAKEMATEMAQ